MGQLELSFVQFKKNAYIIIEGKPNADRFFIIREGKVKITRQLEAAADSDANSLTTGDFFGVVSTMSGHSHIETAQAVTDVLLISLHREQYGQFVQKNPAIALKMIRYLSRRIRILDEALTRLVFKNIAETGPNHLLKVGEYYHNLKQYDHAYYAFNRYLQCCPSGEHCAFVREQISKIAPFTQMVRQDYGPEEFERQFPKDSIIFAEGEPGEELYIIKSGSVKISKIVDNNEFLLAVLKAGDIFGEMALLESKSRAASAVAYEDCSLMVVNRRNFEQMVNTDPHLIPRLTSLFSDRTWFIYKQLANTLLKDPLGRMYDLLLIYLEKRKADLQGNQPHAFDFGPKELVNMAALSPKEGAPVLQNFLSNRKIQILHDKIFVTDISEIKRQAEYFRIKEKLDRSRQSRQMGNRA